ncbi:UNVERIFIED_ORG: hypothetical protein ABIB19_003579 [Arthrobacter sp. UYEF10]
MALHLQWKRNGTAILGATERSYTLTEQDQGKAITVTVTGSKDAFASVARTSTPTPVIAAAESYVDPPTPEILVQNTDISVGTRVRADSFYMWANSELSFSHQWKRDGADIAGATGEEYVLTADDVGHRMTVTMTGWRPGWATVTKTSAASDTVVAGPPPAYSPPADTRAPVVNPSIADGSYLQGQPVRLAADETAAVYYTIDGSIPSRNSSRYDGPLTLNRDTELRYIGVDTAGNQSVPDDRVYTIRLLPAPDLRAPSVSPSLPDGQYLTGQRLEFSTDEIAAVYYTSDGTTPTTNSPQYTAPLKMMTGATYRYIAVDTSGNASAPQSSTYTIQPASFADIGTGTQFFSEINWLAREGVSTGWDEGSVGRTFRPLQPVNRDAMAAFMYRLAGHPPFTPPAVSPFADIAPSTQFYKEITWLSAQGISTGWDEGDGQRTFRALQPVNRDAMAAFMYRLAGSPQFGAAPGSVFTDVTGSLFHKEISWLTAKGISTGYTEPNWTKTYRPLTAINRDAMAAFMYRFNSVFSTE